MALSYHQPKAGSRLKVKQMLGPKEFSKLLVAMELFHELIFNFVPDKKMSTPPPARRWWRGMGANIVGKESLQPDVTSTSVSASKTQRGEQDKVNFLCWTQLRCTLSSAGQRAVQCSWIHCIAYSTVQYTHYNHYTRHANIPDNITLPTLFSSHFTVWAATALKEGGGRPILPPSAISTIGFCPLTTKNRHDRWRRKK